MTHPDAAQSDTAPDDLPSYSTMLHAYHRAHSSALRAILAQLPIQPGDRVLDVASGDGCYTAWLAERAGHVIGVDLSACYLELASRITAQSPYAERICFRQADATALPFPNESIDVAWCAQSLFSLPAPLAVLREMVRVTRRGGYIAILESDTLHQLLMPWPIELELAARQAQLKTLAAEYAQAGPDKFYVGRNLYGLFHQCDVTSCSVRTHAIDLHAPLNADEQTFLQYYLDDLRERAWPHLGQAERAAFDMLFDPHAPTYLPRQPDFHLTHLELLALAQK